MEIIDDQHFCFFCKNPKACMFFKDREGIVYVAGMVETEEGSKEWQCGECYYKIKWDLRGKR